MTGPVEPRDPNGAWVHGEGQLSRQPARTLYRRHSRGLNCHPEERGCYRAVRERSGSRSSAATVLLSAVPWFFWSFAVVSWIVGLLGIGWGWLLVLLWIASGAVVFVRPAGGTCFARYLFRLRVADAGRESSDWRPIWGQLAGSCRGTEGTICDVDPGIG